MGWRTLGKTRTQETRNLLDETLGSNEGIVTLSKLLDELLVLVHLPEVFGRHAIETVVLRTVKVVLVTKNTITVSYFFLQIDTLIPSSSFPSGFSFPNSNRENRVERTRCSCWDEER